MDNVNINKKLEKNINNGNHDINLLEGFEGIRKDNSRMIFGILLTFIIGDFIYECLYD